MKHPHTMTYWKKGELDRHNQPQWDGPFTSKCRWEDSQRLFYTEDGHQSRGQSTVYTPENILTTGDKIYFGKVDSEEPPADSYEVKRPRAISNLRGTRTEYRYIA